MRDYGDRDSDRERWRDDEYGPNRRGTWGQGPPRPRSAQGGYRPDRFNRGEYGHGGGSWDRDRVDWDHRESDFGGYAGYGGYGDDGGYGGYAENRGYSGDTDADGRRYRGDAGPRAVGPGHPSEARSGPGGPWRGRYAGIGPKNYRRSDERIVEEVNDRLTSADLDASEIEVTASEGVVTLRGSVETRSDKRHAEDVADSVPGVVDVRNELTIVAHAQSEVDMAKGTVGIHD